MLGVQSASQRVGSCILARSNAEKYRVNPKVLILPGLNGTDELLRQFVQVAPSHIACEIVTYKNEFATLDEFVDAAATRIAPDEKVFLLAESFSGPVAAQIASRFSSRIAGIIFAASFVEPPYAALLKLAQLVPTLAFSTTRATLMKLFCLNGVRDETVLSEALKVLSALDAVVIKRRLTVLGGSSHASLKTCGIPVLSLRATSDRLVTKAASSSIERVFPNTIGVDFAAPHFLLQVHAEECWQHIAQFVAHGARSSAHPP